MSGYDSLPTVLLTKPQTLNHDKTLANPDTRFSGQSGKYIRQWGRGDNCQHSGWSATHAHAVAKPAIRQQHIQNWSHIARPVCSQLGKLIYSQYWWHNFKHMSTRLIWKCCWALRCCRVAGVIASCRMQPWEYTCNKLQKRPNEMNLMWHLHLYLLQGQITYHT